MTRMTHLLVAVLATMFATGCVSSSTGSPTRFEPDDDAALQNYQLGARYYRNGNYELARDRLTRALELDPKLAVAHSTLALTYEALDNRRLAEEHYEKSVKYAPNNYDVRNMYAVFLCRYGRYDEALKQFDKGIHAYDNDYSEIMLTNAGVCMAQKPDFVKAEQYLREALSKKPTYGEALIQMSALKLETGENLPARGFLQRYLSIHEASPAVLYLGVQIEQKLGDERASTDYTNQILRDFPESAEARHIRDSG